MPAAVLVAAHRYPPRITLVDAVELAEAYEPDEDDFDHGEVELEVADETKWTAREQFITTCVCIVALALVLLGLLAVWRYNEADDQRTKRARAEACSQAPEGDATDIAACIATAG